MKSSTSSVRYEWVLVSPPKSNSTCVPGAPLPCSRLSPTAMFSGKSTCSLRRSTPPARIAASIRRNLAIATANGFLSTPWTDDEGLADQLPLVGAGLLRFPGRQQLAERAEQEVAAAAGRVDHAQAVRQVLVAVGRGRASRPNSSIAGSSVYLRMNSSTNSGVWSRA